MFYILFSSYNFSHCEKHTYYMRGKRIDWSACALSTGCVVDLLFGFLEILRIKWDNGLIQRVISRGCEEISMCVNVTWNNFARSWWHSLCELTRDEYFVDILYTVQCRYLRNRRISDQEGNHLKRTCFFFNSSSARGDFCVCDNLWK